MSTVSTPEYETAEGLDEATAAAVHRQLRAIADTKLLLGYHYGEWTFGTPELEAAVANCSLSQSELGHVRLLDGVLKKFYADDPDRTLKDRPPEAFANIDFLDRDLAGWPGCIAMNAVVDFGITRLLHAMRNSTFRPIRQNVSKMLDEERYHVHHGRGWMRTWAARDEASRNALAAQVGEALHSVARWFGPENEPEDRALVAAGIKATSNWDIAAAVRSDVEQLAGDLDLPLLPAAAPEFGSWSATTRRVNDRGPSEEILAHLRGDRNDMFKLS